MFAESEYKSEPDFDGLTQSYTFFTVWTAIASEDIKAQFSVIGVGTGEADQIGMFMMNLSDDLTENTDWFFDFNSTATTLSTTFSTTNNATVTFTPATAGQDYAVFTSSRMTVDSLAVQYESRIRRTGELTEQNPNTSQEAENSADAQLQTNMRPYNLGAASNTFTEESRIDAAGGGTETRTHSSVFVLRLNAFNTHENAYAVGTIQLSTTAYATQVNSVTIPGIDAGNVWGFGSWRGAFADSTEGHAWRMQVDQVDSPPTQTADAYRRGPWDGDDLLAFQVQTVENLIAGPHAFDLDGDTTNSDVSNVAAQRGIFAVTMKLGVAATLKQIDIIATGVVGFTKEVGKSFAITAVGVPTVAKLMGKLFEIIAGGVVSLGSIFTDFPMFSQLWRRRRRN